MKKCAEVGCSTRLRLVILLAIPSGSARVWRSSAAIQTEVEIVNASVNEKRWPHCWGKAQSTYNLPQDPSWMLWRLDVAPVFR